MFLATINKEAEHTKGGDIMTRNELLVENWNMKYPVGTPVRFQFAKGGDWKHTTTRSAAYVADNGEPVVFLENVSGYYALDCVEPDKP